MNKVQELLKTRKEFTVTAREFHFGSCRSNVSDNKINITFSNPDNNTFGIQYKGNTHVIVFHKGKLDGSFNGILLKLTQGKSNILLLTCDEDSYSKGFIIDNILGI